MRPTWRQGGHVQRSRKDRRCDCGCGAAIPKGTTFLAVQGDRSNYGPHAYGYWYYALPCAERLGWCAPVVAAPDARPGVTE